MVGNKGLSPIIATILLIAFAVALGAMIMNWSSELVGKGAVEGDCAKTTLTTRTPVCFADNKIKIDVINRGEIDLAAVYLNLKTADGSLDRGSKINTEVKINNILTKSIPEIKPTGDFTISLFAAIKSGEDEVKCETPAYTTTDLPLCQ